MTDRPGAARVLTNLLRTGKIPHALLFTGIDGVGRYHAAIEFAMALNCTAPKADSTTRDDRRPGEKDGAAWRACGTCPTCKKINAGMHPDIIRVQPANNAVKIAHIRSLRDALALKPYDARHRFAIVEKAQLMTVPAANALLKILEEPPAGTTLILIASKPSDLITTITSRCQHLRFPPLPEAQIAKAIAASEGIDAASARIIAAMAGGSDQTARDTASEQWLRHRDWLIDELIQMHHPANADRESRFRRTLVIADVLARDSQQLPNRLGIIKSWLRDAAVLPFAADQVINRDKTDQIAPMAASVSPRTLSNCFKDLEKTEKQIRANANPRLALETFLISLMQAISPVDGMASIGNHGKNRRYPV